MTCYYEINDIFLCTINVVATQPFLISEECSHNTQGETASNMRVSLKVTFCVVPAHEAFCCRPVHLLLHTGPLVHTPQCYSSTEEEPLPMVQLTPCDYWVIGVHEGNYWCKDYDYDWRKMRSPVPERLLGSVRDLINLTLIAPTDDFESLEENFSTGQKQVFGEVKTDGARFTHCGVLNLTGNTMLLTDFNITCPAQTEKDEHGVERYWPAINLGKYGRTQTYSHVCLFCSIVLIAMGDYHASPMV